MTNLDDIHIGDRVRIEKGAEAHEGIVFVSYGTEKAIGDVPIHLSFRLDDGWTVTVLEKAAPPLPTEPGLYLSAADGGPWVFELQHDDEWWLLNTNSLFPKSDGHLQRNAPFTRLEPVPVTVQKVIDYLVDYGFVANHPAIESIREHFGVVS